MKHPRFNAPPTASDEMRRYGELLSEGAATLAALETEKRRLAAEVDALSAQTLDRACALAALNRDIEKQNARLCSVRDLFASARAASLPESQSAMTH